MSFSLQVPFTNPHGSIVVGRKGACISHLQEQFGCTITTINKTKPPQTLPFFNIEGSDERQVNRAALKVFSLLNSSMIRNEKSLKHESLMFKEAFEDQSKLHILEVDELSTHIVSLESEKDEKMVFSHTEISIDEVQSKCNRPISFKKYGSFGLCGVWKYNTVQEGRYIEALRRAPWDGSYYCEQEAANNECDKLRESGVFAIVVYGEDLKPSVVCTTSTMERWLPTNKTEYPSIVF